MIVVMMAPATATLAQRVGFRTLAPNAITLTRQGSTDLEFDDLLLDSDMVSAIALSDINRLVVLAVDAPAHYDLIIHIGKKYNDKLLLNGTETDQWIPFTLEFAFANQGYPTTETYFRALPDAVTIPPGRGHITFPISRRASPLPPSPVKQGKHKGYEQRAFLFFYGSLGSANAGKNVVAGSYETTIEVTIDFATHEH